MASTTITAESLLAIDVGTVNTRAILFDVVEGQYRFIAAGMAKTTVNAPFVNIGEGIRRAIHHLQSILGRTFLNEGQTLIIPSEPDGSGIDTFALTVSGCAPLRVVTVGLLDEVSAESARHLAETVYAKVVDVVTLNSYRTQETRIDAIIRARPELVIVAGGTDRGAEGSVMKMVEAVGLACYLMPANMRPEVLYVGNEAVREQVQEALSSLVRLDVAQNIRPTSKIERLLPAQAKLIEMFRRNRNQKIMGLSEFDSWSGRKMLPTATAFQRIIAFLRESYDTPKGVLGIDIGASSTTLSLALPDSKLLTVHSDLGLGEQIVNILKVSTPEEIIRWIPQPISQDDVRDYIYNKAANPFSIPDTKEELFIEQAIARQIMQQATERLRKRLPKKDLQAGKKILPWVEPIIASGSVLTKAPKPGQSLLMLLDGLQPAGITNLVLDQNSITPSLGAAAEINPLLVVQVLESKAFLNLGIVIAPVGIARYGTPVLRVWMMQDDGSERRFDVKYGTIEVIPTPMGKKVELRVLPLQKFDVGMGGAGVGGRLKVVGGMYGIIIDARGRPLAMHNDPVRRQELQNKWMWTLEA